MMIDDASTQDHQESLTLGNTTSAVTEGRSFHGLSDELLVEILKYVPAMDLLRSVTLVSPQVSDVLRLVWRRQLPLQYSTGGLNLHQIQRCCLFHSSNTADQEIPSCLEMGSVLVGRQTARDRLRRRISPRTCFASTTDNISERIENVLMDEEAKDDWKSIRMPSLEIGRSLWGNPYWSSAESPSSDTSEILLFRTEHPTTLISEVAIKPDTDHYNKTYSWKSVVLKVYSLSEISETKDEKALCNLLVRNSMRRFKVDPDQETIERYLAGQRPVYESQVISSLRPESNDWQYFKLPMGVIGNIITITLIGKNTKQFISRGFYVCVRRVATLGIPLHAQPPKCG
mmetsp:Transcript_16223/g.24510  ORF Transcript_16223/g.24510 Transcript_16223/m.24510 type:complete len:343 (-) Transcript_16223:340-1368(-)